MLHNYMKPVYTYVYPCPTACDSKGFCFLDVQCSSDYASEETTTIESGESDATVDYTKRRNVGAQQEDQELQGNCASILNLQCTRTYTRAP